MIEYLVELSGVEPLTIIAVPVVQSYMFWLAHQKDESSLGVRFPECMRSERASGRRPIVPADALDDPEDE